MAWQYREMFQLQTTIFLYSHYHLIKILPLYKDAPAAAILYIDPRPGRAVKIGNAPV